ncbi:MULTISPECIES: sensor histidine kinase [unclassified Streptomyces]|uniref:sensor histidine kinase n=1 Tax=Streptomyces sp. NPDC059271 TaxID=3346799 RepID=UPI003677D07D
MTVRQMMLSREQLLGPVSDWWRARGALTTDGVVAVGAAAVALVPALATLSTVGAQIGDLPQRPPSLWSVGLILAQTLPLAVRRRRPAVCLVVVAGAFAVHQAMGFSTTFASLGLYLALYSAGAHQGCRRLRLVGAMTGGYGVLAVALDRLGSPQGVADYLAFYLALAASWILGSTVRGRRVGEVQRRRLVVEEAAAAERARIARELHDVVTHHVTAMVVQSDAAQVVLTSAPDKAAEGLSAVSDTGRTALKELRLLLGVLEATADKAPAGPALQGRAPALGRLEDLVAQTRRSGQPIEFRELGTRHEHSADVELAAYRVVQEALTNALKHAAGSPTRVVVEHSATLLDITVTTDRPTRATGPLAVEESTAGGRGLPGLRARIQMVSGQLKAGLRADGGFEVHATIPSVPIQE